MRAIELLLKRLTCKHEFIPDRHDKKCCKCGKIKKHKCKRGENEKVYFKKGTGRFLGEQEIQQQYFYYKSNCKICNKVMDYSGAIMS